MNRIFRALVFAAAGLLFRQRQINRRLSVIEHQQNNMADQIEQLDAAISDIKTAAAEEKAQVAAKIAELEAAIEDAKKTQDLSALIAKAEGVVGDVKGIFEPAPVVEPPAVEPAPEVPDFPIAVESAPES